MTYEDLFKMGFLSKNQRRNNCVTSWSSKRRPSSSPLGGLPTITANFGESGGDGVQVKRIGIIVGEVSIKGSEKDRLCH